MRYRPGLAMLLVVGVLGVLAALGSAFAVLSRLERKAAAQRVLGTQALLLARSGVEDAQARLASGQDSEAPSNQYRGEDWDRSGTLNGFETAAEVYRRGKLDRDSCPVRQALRPSFFVQDPSSLGADARPAPRRIRPDGRERGYSGVFGTGAGRTYSLAVRPQGGFYLNGGNPAVATPAGAPPAPGNPPTQLNINDNLKRMLGILAKAIDEEEAPINGSPVSEADGWALVSARPLAGWTSWNQVRDLALGGSQAKMDALKPYLTLSAFVDRKVVRPNAVGDGQGTIYSWAIDGRKFGHGSNAATVLPSYPTTHPLCRKSEPDFEKMPVATTGKVVGRAPVDFQWARHRKPALLALLGNLRAYYYERLTVTVTGQDMAAENRIAIPLTWSATDYAHKWAANFIQTSTSEVKDWEAFRQYVDALPPVTATTTDRMNHPALLKANFNPNTDLQKFNPNRSTFKSLDKSDLRIYSTEFSLVSICDREVESVGRILGPQGKLLASRVLKATLSGPQVAKLTTQKEFAAESLGRLDVAGDEGGVRKPGYLAAGKPEYLTQSAGTSRTWGHRLNVTAGYPGSWMDGDSRGLALQTYPEPCVDPGTGMAFLPANYDGNLQLATVETRENDFYGVTSPTKDMKMLATYTTNLDLAVHDGPGWANVPDTNQVTTALITNGLWYYNKPNCLYPDGTFAEAGNNPSYLDRGNANGLHGLISLWHKPYYSHHEQWAIDLPSSHSPRTILSWTNHQPGGVNPGPPASDDVRRRNQYFWFGFTGVG